ncbi:hypothetical protein P7C70_g807, partial [Phenoliferia sp. Uapishka_3]
MGAAGSTVTVINDVPDCTLFMEVNYNQAAISKFLLTAKILATAFGGLFSSSPEYHIITDTANLQKNIIINTYEFEGSQNVGIGFGASIIQKWAAAYGTSHHVSVLDGVGNLLGDMAYPILHDYGTAKVIVTGKGDEFNEGGLALNEGPRNMLVYFGGLFVDLAN